MKQYKSFQPPFRPRQRLARNNITLEHIIHHHLHLNLPNHEDPQTASFDRSPAKFHFVKGITNCQKLFEEVSKWLDTELEKRRVELEASGQQIVPSKQISELMKNHFVSDMKLRRRYKLPQQMELFARENQIQLVLAFLMMVKLGMQDGKLKKGRVQTLKSYCSCLSTLFGPDSSEFSSILRRTLVFDPILKQFRKTLISIYQSYKLPTPPELEVTQLQIGQLIYRNSQDSNECPEDSLAEDPDLTQEAKSEHETNGEVSNYYNTFQRHYYTPRKVPNTPAHVDYKQGVDVAPTPNFQIGTGRKAKRKRLVNIQKKLFNEQPEEPGVKKRRIA